MKNKKGFILPTVILVFVFLALIIPMIVKWIQSDTKISVKDQKSSLAFNLAEAALDRGYWKLKSSTTTFGGVIAGGALAGYRFDTTYHDVPGGSYRMFLSSGPQSGKVTIIGEGRDVNNKETRAIQVVYQNASFPGPIIAGSKITMADKSTVHWGAILGWGDIVLSASQQSDHFPRKYSKQNVKPWCNSSSDVGDQLEYFCHYDVPELPQFDFEAMKSSAIANGTYNCGSQTGTGPTSSNGYITPCNCSTSKCIVDHIYADKRYNDGLIWYWDETKAVTLNDTGIKGSIIVRGDLTINDDDCYGPWYKTNGYDAYGGYHLCGQGKSTVAGPGALTINMPLDAWYQYAKIDTSATNQYPGDLGLSSSAATYQVGACDKAQYYQCDGTCEEACEGGASGDDIGLYGFLYVGGNIKINAAFDLYGAAWIVGNFNTGGSNNMSVFYDSSIDLPLLNVVLAKQSWQEIQPSAAAWL